MKIEWIDEKSGRSGLVVTEVDRYDGVPSIDSFWLDKAPLNLSQDRLAVASTLVFGPWVTGAFRLPKQVGAGVARSIIRFCEPSWVVPEPIDYGPKPIPAGSGILFTESRGKRTEPSLTRQARRDGTNLTILDSDQYAGSLFSMEGLYVTSNMFAFQLDGAHAPWLPLLAVAVLFAEDLQCSTISIPMHYQETLESEHALMDLLSATGLRLEFHSIDSELLEERR